MAPSCEIKRSKDALSGYTGHWPRAVEYVLGRVYSRTSRRRLILRTVKPRSRSCLHAMGLVVLRIVQNVRPIRARLTTRLPRSRIAGRCTRWNYDFIRLSPRTRFALSSYRILKELTAFTSWPIKWGRVGQQTESVFGLRAERAHLYLDAGSCRTGSSEECPVMRLRASFRHLLA